MAQPWDLEKSLTAATELVEKVISPPVKEGCMVQKGTCGFKSLAHKGDLHIISVRYGLQPAAEA